MREEPEESDDPIPTLPPQTKAISVMQMVSEIPTNEVRMERLRQNLTNMGCEGLMDVPWGIRKESLVADLLLIGKWYLGYHPSDET